MQNQDARPISDAEREVVRAARAWRKAYAPDAPVEVQELERAIDRLEKEYETLETKS